MTDAPKHLESLSRREMIAATAAALVTPLLQAGAVTTQPAVGVPGKFLTAVEYALLDELTELIIPADDHAPGARAAGVAGYIDGRLAESWEEQPRKVWRDGLKRVDALCQKMHGQPFLKATSEQQVAVLSRMAQNEFHPKSEEEKFFAELKRRTVTAYYTSEIGIHKEMEYKGNTLLKEFAGYEGS